ncbi:major facilitator superfamily domain-containing protein [Cercophora newfieldiana]|uniref:Major facilitator superfamily domain-containing protein n=1 Tax=Cercophora newfieldiana TaxID=92897 RepID=A0AA40CIX0_9PEZI|nr:major facilitator superfamily domain-containing protein [Cercophora newfieldiana]
MAADAEKATARVEAAVGPGVRQDRAGSSTDDRLAVDSISGEEKARQSDSELDDAAEERLENGTPALESGVKRAPQNRRASSFAKTATVVPRSERRGLFGRFSIIPEIDRPYDYTRKTKWAITAIVALAAAASPMGSGIFYPVLPELSRDFGATETLVNLTVALYMLSMSIFPLWWSSFSETLGRRTIYIVSFTLFIIFSILSAVSANISMLIVMRMLSGGASASVQAVGAGTIADIWETSERGRAMGIFYLGPLTGPLFAPMIGGALAQKYGWRSTMWFLVIYGAVTFLGIFFGLPETLAKRRLPPPRPSTASNTGPDDLRRVSTARSLKDNTKYAGFLLKRFITEPLQVILYLRYPPVLISVYSASIAFGALFVLNISIQATFSIAPYSFSTIVLGLLYLAPSLGYVTASTLGGRWVDHIMVREAQKAGRRDADGNLVYLPEDRMRENMWLAATLYPAAMIWYGWTAQNGLHWIIPCIANFFFGCGSMLVFGAVTTMLTEFMPRRSSSGVAVNNFVRNIFSCVGAIVAQPLLDAMGNGWLCTMVGLFAWVTGNAAVYMLKKRAPAWRIQMDKAMRDA